MDTKKFRTRQEFKSKINPKGKSFIIGLDAGYSSMKVFYENGYFCFPSFIKKISEENLTIAGEEDILYRDLDTGETYMIGRTAQNMISSVDTNDTESELFSRKRYGQKSFQILCQTAIAIAAQNKKDNREIVIQTGLPTAYVEGDSMSLKKALCKNHNFELKVGLGQWKKHHFEVSMDHIFIMPQPAGSFYSVLIKDNGEYMPDSKELLYSNVLVMDIGFGTFDFYGIKNRAIECKESIDNIGMREVLKKTSGKILDELCEDIRIPSLQKNLETGTIIYVDEEEMRTEEKPLAPYLEKANEEVFQDAMRKAKAVSNTFRDYKYLITSGGTGEAWYPMIQKYLEKMKTLTVLPSNRNSDNLPFIYANARGYYLFRLTMMKR